MNILSNIYETTIPKINFHERKKSIEYNFTILKGGPKSGKTYLIYDYLSKFKEDDYLYIDFDDYKNDKDEIALYLDDFIDQKRIKTVVLENFDFSFPLPKVTSIVITTMVDISLENFNIVFLDPLDFEEYLLFDTKHQNEIQSFNSFLKYGNFPEIFEFHENKKGKRNYEICKLYSNDILDFEILLLFIKNSSQPKSIYQLYTQLKKTKKISKDRFYQTAHILKENHIIFFCQKYNQPKAVKKLFIYNHALMDIVSYKKNLNGLFKNMVFLELYKRYKEIYYLDNIDFYIPNQDLVILTIPFFNNLIVGNITKKVLKIVDEYNIKEIKILTISNQEEFYMDEIKCEVMTFSNWILSL